MSDVIRRDSKGRKLWTGESQEKDGRYKYRYLDKSGKEKQIQKALDAYIMPNGGNTTVLELLQKETCV